MRKAGRKRARKATARQSRNQNRPVLDLVLPTSSLAEHGECLDQRTVQIKIRKSEIRNKFTATARIFRPDLVFCYTFTSVVSHK